MKALYTHNYGSHVTANQLGIEAAGSGCWSEFTGGCLDDSEYIFI